MSNDLNEKIKKEIEETGFPLELRISDFLNRNSYYVAHSSYFVDEDEKKSREVDLRALKNYEIDRINGRSVKAWVRNCFFIECKKSTKNPWVFLCSKKSSYDLDYDKIPCLPRIEFQDKKYLEILKEKHPFASFNIVGRSYFEAFKQTSENIFKAITTVVKSTLYGMDKSFASGPMSVCYYYPMIILEGKLFQGILNNNKIEVKEVDSILLSFLYESKNRENSKFSIPIIQESKVSNFLKEMDEVLDFLGNLAMTNPTKFFPI